MRAGTRRVFSFLIVALVFAVSGYSRSLPDSSSFAEARVAIMWDRAATGAASNDQASFASAFQSLNIQADTISPGQLTNSKTNLMEYNLLIVPNPKLLKSKATQDVISFVQQGGNLILDGQSSLAASFGFSGKIGGLAADSGFTVKRMVDRYYPEDTLRLAVSDKMNKLTEKEDDEVLCREATTGNAVTVVRQYGSGKVLYFGILFDPVSSGGYSRFPFLMQYVWDFFSLRPILRREYLEMYFDPGFRHNENVDSLARTWKSAGIQVIHAAAWHQHATWTYNYTRLVSACHAQGMRIYAWLEPPHVSEKFWRQYPAWKEVNYRGETILPQWRYLEALTDSNCLQKVKEDYSNLLNAYEWDGVNLAELYFESDRGTSNPSKYTPMHPSARAEFSKLHGFDPALLFVDTSKVFWKRNHKALNLFERYRSEKVVRLHEELLKTLEDARKDKGSFDVIVTAFDDMSNPKLRSYLGADIRGLIKLQKKYSFTLQVEDPQSRWSNDPRRYIALGERYRSLLGRRQNLMLDLNILNYRDRYGNNPFPTEIQTGIESYQMVYSAASASDRMTMYSESSVRPDDLRFFPYAASAPASVRRVQNGWSVKTPFPVTLELPEQFAFLRLSTGEELRSDHGRFMLPEGEYTLLIK